MRKVISLIIGLLLITSLSYAQATRNASNSTIQFNRTNFGNVGVHGLAVFGNPGYISMRALEATDGDTPADYYLWVDHTGDLCIASHATVVADSGFPDGDWNSITCSVVGSQS